MVDSSPVDTAAAEHAISEAGRIDQIIAGLPKFQPLVGPDDLARVAPTDPRPLAERINPPNWPLEILVSTALTIIQDEGIPLVWVPRKQIVRDIVAALYGHLSGS